MPLKELNRLEAVNRFLKIKIDKQEEFRQIAQLAADICGMPTGLITLIDSDKEYILKEDMFVVSSGRNESFCHYVLESDDVMIVSDALQDPVLKAYPAVTREAGIRFYAGAPLTTQDGYRLGSLCVIDQKPGELIQIQKDMLENLARQIIQLLEFESNLYFLKMQFLESKKRELKMRSFFESTATIHLLLDKNLEIVAYNKAAQIAYNSVYHANLQLGLTAEQFLHQSHLKPFTENCKKALNGETITSERLLDFQDYSLWYMITYNPARDSSGQIIGISINCTDVTRRMERQQAAIQHQARLDQMAYMQSHEFRRPVATIKGLLNLLEMDEHDKVYPQLKVIKKAINEIDEKIAEIVSFTITKPKH